MPSRKASPLRRLFCALTGAIAVCANAETPQELPTQPAAAPLAVRDALIWSKPDMALRYELQPPQEGQQGRALVQGEVDTGASRVRAQVRIDPGAQGRPTSGVDLSMQLPAPGVLQGLVVGDGYTSGAGWSPPARMTGLRFGRAQSMRAPLRADPAAFTAPTPIAGVTSVFAGATTAFPGPASVFIGAPTASTAFAGSQPGRGWGSWRADARSLLPTSNGPAAPTPGDAHPLEAGATDYEVEVGRLREGWDTTDRNYLGQYTAAAYRAGIGLGLTAEARTEWSATGSAHGVELLKDLGRGAMLQGLAAQSTATDAGSGGRWGAGLVLPGDLWRWKLTYAAADREFRTTTGGAEARRGMRLETGARWRGASVDASFSHNEVWDVAIPESIVAVGGRLDLTRQVQLRMDLARRASIDPAWRAGVSVSLPLE